IDGARAQSLLLQSHRIIIGVVVVCLRSPVSRLHAISNRRSQIITESWHEPLRFWGDPRYRRRNWLAENPEHVGSGGDFLCGRCERRFLVLNVPPLGAFRRLAPAAARALRVAKWQSHLEGEIRAQKIWKVGTVGLNYERLLIFMQTQMIE